MQKASTELGSFLLREPKSLCFPKMVFKVLTSAVRRSALTWRPFLTRSGRAGTPAWSPSDITTPRWVFGDSCECGGVCDSDVSPQVLQQLSCTARRHGLYLVANMADLQPCSTSAAPPSCPPDGRWHFNTNVVFRYWQNSLIDAW